MTVYVGYWARRIGPWHLVESEIADRIVTRCGREMQTKTSRGELTFTNDPSPRCKQCTGRQP